jgi:hypothetical protein
VLANIGGTDINTLAGIQAAFGGNMNSHTIQPVFVSALDAHLDFTSNSALDNKGTPIAGITTDIDGQVRNALTPDIGADEFEVITGIDLGAKNLVTPAVKDCYATNETVTIRIRNYSANPHNFALLPVTLTSSVSGTNPMVFAPVIINTGMLAAGDSLDVIVATNYDMSAIGTYTFNATTTVAADVNVLNNDMPPTDRTLNLVQSGTVTSTASEYCLSGSPVFTLTGSTGTIQWQQAPDATGTWTNVGTGTGTFTPGVVNQTTFYRAVVTCNANSDTSNVFQLTINNPTILTTTPATRCGAGTVTLGATGSGATDFNWYAAATGGMPVGNGANFTTPVINANTTYYVSATSGGVSTSLGKAAYTSTDGTNTAGAYLVFDALSSFTLNSVVIYPSGTAAGTVTINLTNSAGVVLQSAVINTTGSTVATPVVAPLNFNITPGTGYRLVYGSSTGGVTAMFREFSAGAGISFPYTVPGVVSITNGSLTWYCWLHQKQVLL